MLNVNICPVIIPNDKIPFYENKQINTSNLKVLNMNISVFICSATKSLIHLFLKLYKSKHMYLIIRI